MHLVQMLPFLYYQVDPITTWGPLIMVLMVTAVREGMLDTVCDQWKGLRSIAPPRSRC